MSDTNADRHTTWSHLEDYLKTGSPAMISIEGEPPLHLVVEPLQERIAIRGPWKIEGEMPILTQYRYFDSQTGTSQRGDWIEFGVTGRHVLRDAYPLLVEVANQMQQNGENMGNAVGQVLFSYRELLSTLGRLTDQQEIGLFGELLVAEALIPQIGELETMNAWRGAEWEEHDYGLEHCDLEVKTTTQDERRHRISSLNQLQPSYNRDLWLVSVQLRVGGLEGRTLPILIQDIEDLLVAQAAKNHYSGKLAQCGWVPECAHLYDRRYVERGEILAFEVVAEFPRLTVQKLTSSGIAVERLSDVSYTISLAGLPNGISPNSLIERYHG